MDDINKITHYAQLHDLGCNVTAYEYTDQQIDDRRLAIVNLENEIMRIQDFQLHLRNGHIWHSDEENGTSRCTKCGWNGDI